MTGQKHAAPDTYSAGRRRAGGGHARSAARRPAAARRGGGAVACGGPGAGWAGPLVQWVAERQEQGPGIGARLLRERIAGFSKPEWPVGAAPRRRDGRAADAIGRGGLVGRGAVWRRRELAPAGSRAVIAAKGGDSATITIKGRAPGSEAALRVLHLTHPFKRQS